MSGVLLDIRYALRLLRTHPGFSAVVILTLALGVGANTALFSVIDAVWLRAVPGGHADRLVAVWLTANQSSRILPGTADFEQWQQHVDIFEALSSIATARASVSIGSQSHDISVAHVQAELFSILGERPLVGRLLVPSDDASGAPAVAVVSRDFYYERLGGDPRAIGTSLRIVSGAQTETVTVAGVLPERFSRMVRSDVIVPAGPLPAVNPRSRRPLRVVGLLAPGLSVTHAQALIEARPSTTGAFRPRIVPLRDSIVGADVGRVLNVLFGAVGLLLLIACANVANLLLARLAGREREIAVRAAVGAGRWRLARQLLIESLMLSMIGAAAGLLLARITRPLLISLMPARTPGLEAIAFDGRVLAFTILAAVVTSILSGLWPVVRMSQARADRILAGRTNTGTTRAGTSRALLAVEIALALAVVIAAGTLVHSFINLVNVDPGFKPENVMTVRVAPAPPPPDGPRASGRVRFNPAQLEQDRRVLQELRRLPFVEAAAGVASLPMGGGGASYTMGFEGREVADGDEPWVGFHRVSPGYFETLAIPLRRGRTFTAEDRRGAPGVAIVNELAARRFWPGEDPIGQRVFLGSREPLTVVGIVGDMRQRSIAEEPGPEVYRPWQQDPSTLSYVVRTSDASLLRTLAAPGASIAGARVTEVGTLDELVTRTVREPRARMLLFLILGGVVLLLTIVGVAALTAHAVSRRTREAGIRLALGARPREIVALMMAHSAIPLALGLAAGLIAAWWTTRLLQGMLFEVTARDPLTFAGSVVVLMLSALAAAWLPARRTARLDPAITLRQE